MKAPSPCAQETDHGPHRWSRFGARRCPGLRVDDLDRVPVEESIGCRLPGKTWTIGYVHRRGTGWRVRERPADNNWEDVTLGADGCIEVIKEAPDAR